MNLVCLVTVLSVFFVPLVLFGGLLFGAYGAWGVVWSGVRCAVVWCGVVWCVHDVVLCAVCMMCDGCKTF